MMSYNNNGTNYLTTMNTTKLRIGTDCSGIEAPLFALQKIKNKHPFFDYEHVFSSDIDPFVIKVHKENFSPKIMFQDITKRDVNSIPPIDIYIAGFPCQPFSKANKFQFETDERKQVFFGCLDVLKKQNPRIFIFENVKTLKSHENGSTFERIIKELNDLNKYDIHTQVVNSKDYGVPQARDRLYIIGILKEKKTGDFTFPKKQKMKSLKQCIDKKSYPVEPIKEKNKPLFSRLPKGSVFVDIGFREASFPNSHKWAPCITAQANMWNVMKQRRATVNEYLMLQGFPIDFFNQTVGDHRFKKIIGNAMTVNVIEALLLNALPCAGVSF